MGRISHFPIDFRMGLTTVQRYCAASDVDRLHLIVNWLITFKILKYLLSFV